MTLLGSGLLGSRLKIRGVLWLWLDRFATDLASGAVNGTVAEPGPGTRTAPDANNIISITGGRMRYSGTPVTTGGYYSGPYARRPGRAFKVSVPPPTTPVLCQIAWGVGNVAAPAGQPMNTTDVTGVQIQNTTTVLVRSAFNSFGAYTAGLTGSTHDFLHVLRHNGSILLVGNAEDASYTLLWVFRGDTQDTLANMWAKIQPRDTTALSIEFDDFEIVDIGGVLATEYGFATDRKATAAINDTLTHTADGLIEFTWTPGSAETLNFMFRRTDDNNCWIARCDQAGSTFRLITVAAGSETQRTSNAVTWTVGTPYRIHIRMQSNSIFPVVNVTAQSAITVAHQAAATGAKVNLAGLEFVSYPLTLAKTAIIPAAQRPIDWVGNEFLAEIAQLRNTTFASGSHNVIYLGGSITVGALSSDNESTSWRALMSDWLDDQFPDATLTHVNSGVGGTPSWYGLIRLQTDVIDYNPALVFVDFAVNDSSNAWDQPSAEALCRRLRSALPNATIVTMFNLQVTDYTTNTTTNLKDPIKQWWKKLAVAYRMPWFDFANYVATVVAAGATQSTYLADNVHPTDAGHAALFAGLQSLMSATAASDTNDYLYPWSTHLPVLPRINTSTSVYENSPTITDGIDAAGETGSGWSTVDTTARQSSTADDTISFTATCQSFGLDTNVGGGAGVVGWSVDGGAYTNITLSAQAVTNQPVTSFTRGAHTITLKVISGAVRINRFLAI